jgi:VWFA-related protein
MVRTLTRELALMLLILVAATSLLAREAGPSSPVGGPESTQQEPPPRFEAEVEQVVVDVVVTDKEGNPVRGLRPEDLIVTEDGTSQTIKSFEAVALPDEPAPRVSALPRISKNTEPAAQRGRAFVIVFDDVHLTPQRERDAKAAVASFLTNGVREGDSVTLVATSGDAWWTARMPSGRDKLIEILEQLTARRVFDISLERMSDWEAMRIHVYHDEQVARRVMQRYESLGVMMIHQADLDDPMPGTTIDPFVTARATEVYLETRTRSQATMGVLERVLNGLASARGRKSVILVSEGFIHDPNLEEFRRVNVASRRANAAIYFVNARGLEGMPADFSAQFGPPMPQGEIGFTLSAMSSLDDGSEGLAEDSGGFTVKNTNDLDRAIQRIARETQVYYLLGYVPTNTARDGRFRKIEVRVKDGKDLTVRARKGYYAPSADGQTPVPGPEGVDPLVQAALDSPWSEDGIPLRMTHYVRGEPMLGKAQVVLASEVDVDALEFEPREGREVAEIEFLLVVAHRETGEYYRYDQTVTMRLRPATRERLSRQWYPIVREFALPPGDYQARIVVRETGTGVIGSVIHDFEVPPLGQFRVSTPVLTDIWRPGPPGTGVQPQLLARREFPPGAELVCQFEVYGGEKDEDGMPRVAQGYTVFGPDGTVFKRLPESVINPTSLGALARVFILSLDYATPGDYEMVLNFRDELSGKTLELREPFSVVPPPSASGDTDGGTSADVR